MIRNTSLPLVFVAAIGLATLAFRARAQDDALTVSASEFQRIWRTCGRAARRKIVQTKTAPWFVSVVGDA